MALVDLGARTWVSPSDDAVSIACSCLPRGPFGRLVDARLT